jgi:hypothetical protein
MPAPSGTIATLRPDLAASFMEFDLAADREGFIASRVLPFMEVGVRSGTFGRISIEQLLKARDTVRTSQGSYNRGNWTFDDEPFKTLENGVEEKVDDRDVALYAEYFDAEQISAQRAFDGVLREAEKRVSALIFNATTWTGAALTTTVGTEWSTLATATPIADVEAAVRLVWDGTGIWPDTLILNRKVFRNLRLSNNIQDAIRSAGAGDSTKPTDVTAAMLAQVFDLPKIVVAGSAKDSALEGQSTTIAPIWSDEYAMICKTGDDRDIRKPVVGRTFHWGVDGSTPGGTVESYRDEPVRGDIIRVRHETHEKVIYAQLGHLLSNITA